jgi:hypothetical protein
MMRRLGEESGQWLVVSGQLRPRLFTDAARVRGLCRAAIVIVTYRRVVRTGGRGASGTQIDLAPGVNAGVKRALASLTTGD